MAEVFRIQGGDVRRSGGGASAQVGRDVLYDYAEAEALWNESDTTAPGPGGALPRAAFLSPVNEADEGSEGIEGSDGNDPEEAAAAALAAYQRARRWRLIRSRLLLAAAGVLVAGVSYLWGAAGRPPVAVVAPRLAPHPTAILIGSGPALGSTSAGPEATASVNLAAQAPSVAGPPPVPPAAGATVEVAARPVAIVVAAGEGGGTRRRGADRHRARRPAALTEAPAAGEWVVEPAEPAPRGRRTRLRPIDVTDPFAR